VFACCSNGRASPNAETNFARLLSVRKATRLAELSREKADSRSLRDLNLDSDSSLEGHYCGIANGKPRVECLNGETVFLSKVAQPMKKSGGEVRPGGGVGDQSYARVACNCSGVTRSNFTAARRDVDSLISAGLNPRLGCRVGKALVSSPWWKSGYVRQKDGVIHMAAG